MMKNQDSHHNQQVGSSKFSGISTAVSSVIDNIEVGAAVCFDYRGEEKHSRQHEDESHGEQQCVDNNMNITTSQPHKKQFSASSSDMSYHTFLQQLFKHLCNDEQDDDDCSEENSDSNEKVPARSEPSSSASSLLSLILLELVTLHPSEIYLSILYAFCMHPSSIPKNDSTSFSGASGNESSGKSKNVKRTSQQISVFLQNHQEMKEEIEEMFSDLEINYLYQSKLFHSGTQATSFILRLISSYDAVQKESPTSLGISDKEMLSRRNQPNIDAIKMMIRRYPSSALYDGPLLDAINTTTLTITSNNVVEAFQHVIKEASTTAYGSSALDLACRHSNNPVFIVAMIEAIFETFQFPSDGEDASTSISNNPPFSYLQYLLKNYDYECEQEQDSVAMKILNSISNSLIYRKDSDVCSKVLLYSYCHQDKHRKDYATTKKGNNAYSQDEKQRNENHIIKVDLVAECKKKNHASYTPSNRNSSKSIELQQLQETKQEEVVQDRTTNEEDFSLSSSHSSPPSSTSCNNLILDLFEKAATSGHTETLKALLKINPHVIFQRNSDTLYMVLQTTVLNFRYESNRNILRNFLPEHEWLERIKFLLKEGINYQIKYKRSPYLIGGLFAVESHIDGFLEEIIHLFGKQECWKMLISCLGKYSYDDVPILEAAIGKTHDETLREMTEYFKAHSFFNVG